MEEAPFLITIEGAVATIAINRPQARNSLIRGMGGQLHAHLQKIAQDDSIRVLVLRGVGKDFCPGADLTYRAPAETPAPQPDFAAYEVTLLLHEMPQLTIAAIRGGCAGAGFGWACACDLRVADETAKFNTAFLDVGVAGDMAVPWTLPRLIGAGRARALMFTPQKLSAAQAHALGLIEELWTQEAFEAALSARTAQLAAAAPLALKAMKSHFIAAEQEDLRSFIRREAERHIALLQTEDHREAVRAFSEKRPGKFTGR